MPSQNTFLDRLIDRLDRLDPSSVQTYLQKLIREKGFLETVFSTIQEGILVVDKQFRVRYANTSACRLLGLPEEPEGVSLVRFIRDIDWHGLIDEDGERWRGVGFHEVEIFYPRHLILTFYLVPHPRVREEEKSNLATLIFQDVTEHRKYTEELIEQYRAEAITQLAAGVAHEIGNPLNSLLIHLQLLGRSLNKLDGQNVEQARELLDVALHEVSRLDSITSDFLRAVRPVQPVFAPLKVQQLLTESLHFMRREIEDRGVRVEASLPKNLPMIQGDAGQLKQVFYNILKNSIQAMSAGGLIEIVCTTTAEFLEIRIVDDGKGISKDNIGRIMEPYFSTHKEGGGLGMMIVERIIRSHNGELSVESEEGEGTTLTIRLPLRERRARLLAAGSQSERNEES